MRRNLRMLLVGIGITLSSAVAQPQFSVGLSGGVSFIPSPNETSFIVGGSSWFHVIKPIWLSGEFLYSKGCDRYPDPPLGYLLVRRQSKSRTQRLAMGLHYPIKFKNVSTLNLLGINFGHSWDHCDYRVFEFAQETPDEFIPLTKDIQRSVLFGSLTAISPRKNFPFFLQARYGVSFSRLSSFSLVASKDFIHVVAGVHWGVFD